jgi:hypothetical protein
LDNFGHDVDAHQPIRLASESAAQASAAVSPNRRRSAGKIGCSHVSRFAAYQVAAFPIASVDW